MPDLKITPTQAWVHARSTTCAQCSHNHDAISHQPSAKL